MENKVIAPSYKNNGGSMTIQIERENNKFQVKTQYFNLEWIPDTPANRKTTVVFLRLMENENNKKLFTLQELAKITKGTTANASIKAIKQFEQKDRDFHQLHVYHKPKIDEKVIETIKEIVKEEPLAQLEEIARKANQRLNRTDINRWHIEWALAEYVPYYEIRKTITRQLEKGEYNYREEYVLNRLFQAALQNGQEEETRFIPDALKEKWQRASEPIVVDTPSVDKIPENAKELFAGATTKEKLKELWQGPFGWYMWAFILYFNGISLSVIGRWLGVHKSTVCRWLDKVAIWSKSLIDANNLSKSLTLVKTIAIDEKWISINGVIWYLFAAVDCVTGYPVHVDIYPSNSIACCKCFLTELKNRGYHPNAIITDGWDAYITSIKDIFPNTEHLLCRFHAIKRLLFKLRYIAHITEASVFRLAGKLFKTLYKKTVNARLERLTRKLRALEAEHVVKALKSKMPTLLKSVGSTWRPSTANAVESFFSHFERFYRLKGPFPDQESAQKHLQLFMLGYLFTIGADWQACPLEKVGYDVVQVPFYHLLNRPDVVSLKERMSA